MIRRPDLRAVPSDMSAMSLRGGVAHFLHHIEARGAALNTLNSYGGDLSHFIACVERLQAGDLVAVQSARTVARFFDDQHARGISRRSQARRLSVLRAFFRHARREGWIGHDPTADERIRFDKQPVIAPELPTLHAVIDAIPEDGPLNLRDRAMLRLFLDTGIRISALRGLDAPGYGSATAVDLKRGLATYVRKGGGYASKPFNEATGRVLERWLAVRADWAVDGTPALFVSARGERLCRNSVHQVVVRHGKRAGLKLHSHLFRHRRGAHIIERCDIKLAQQFLDHANIATTSEYGLRADNVAHQLLRERADIDAGRAVA